MLSSIYLFDNTVEAIERSVSNLNCIANIIWNDRLLIPNDSLISSSEDPVDVSLSYRSGVIKTSEKAQHIRHKTQCMRYLTMKVCLYQHIARKKKLLLDHTLTITELGILLSWQKNLSDILLQQSVFLHQRLEIFLYLSFLTANGTQNIPSHSWLLSHLSNQSLSRIYQAHY